jgi:ABC-type phosphate transport system substrate-binding protein
MKFQRTGAWLLGLLLLPGLGSALPLSEYRSGPDDTLDLFVAGSSAQDNTLQQLFRVICEANSLDVYRADGGNVRLLFCRTKRGEGAIPGIAAGTKIALHKSSLGGSGTGVGPLIERTPVEFLNVADVRAHFEERCPPGGRSHHTADSALIAYTQYECLNPAPDHEVPDAGISDVEPQFILSVYRLAPDAINVLSVNSSNAFIFGVPVTLSLRNALQAARFPREDSCNPNNPHYLDLVDVNRNMRVKRGEAEQCMPSLSRAQLAGIFSGTIAGWKQIADPQGYPLAARGATGGPIRSAPGVRAPSDDRVYICRRVETSGTQAAYEMFFLNQRCTSGVRPFVATGSNIFLGSGSADVESCLNQLDRKNLWAVGILSTENVESLKDDGWRFIKMDGIAPTLFNTYSGHWPFFVQQTYQWRNEQSQQPLRGPKVSLMAHIGIQLSNPVVIRELNREFRHAWGSAGVMALSDRGLIPPPLPLPGKPVDEAAVDVNPTLAVKHDANNCGAVVAQYPTVPP